MCGICGQFHFDGTEVRLADLKAMAGTLEYRGPDDAGFRILNHWHGENHLVSIGLGHRRLAIIDLSASGRQPMTNEDGTVWLTFNGEIYNFQKLRRQLRQKGHVFKSLTDSEVIVHLYEEHGVEAVHQLNGMFAFTLWDQRAQKLWICRDRIGIKPVVYHWDGKTLTLASEIKALLATSRLERQIDPLALMLYLTYGYIPAPYTIFRGIRKLAPGHMLVLEGERLDLISYWDITASKGNRFDDDVAKEPETVLRQRLFETLSDAVRYRMVADVPLGAFLSGGIDSSIIVALMARHTDRAVKTFSIGFKDDPLYDETHYARDVARACRTDHHEIMLSYGDLLDVFPTVLDTFDEPFSDSSAIPTYIVSRETRKHVTVALSGDGGDELFGGYRSYLAEYWYRKYRLIPSLVRKCIIERVVDSLPDARDAVLGELARRAKKFIRGTQGTFHQRVLALKEIFPSSIRKNILMPSSGLASGNGGDPALSWTAHFLDRFKGDRINRMLYFDLKDSLPGDMLTKVDWMSMKNSLEVRVPFLDHRVVELAFEISGAAKLRRGVTKHFLKETFKSLLPNRLQQRPKAGFEIPISRWLRTELKPLLETYLAEDRIRANGIFDYAIVNNLIESHMQRKTDTSWMLWNLIVFQHWYENFFI